MPENGVLTAKQEAVQIWNCAQALLWGVVPWEEQGRCLYKRGSASKQSL